MFKLFQSITTLLKQVLITARKKAKSLSQSHYGSYMGMIMSEVLYQAPKKDHLCEAEPNINDYFACKAKPSKGKIDCPRAQRVQASFFSGLIKCRDHNKPPYMNLYFIRVKISFFTICIINMFASLSKEPSEAEEKIIFEIR